MFPNAAHVFLLSFFVVLPASLVGCGDDDHSEPEMAPCPADLTWHSTGDKCPDELIRRECPAEGTNMCGPSETAVCLCQGSAEGKASTWFCQDCSHFDGDP